MDTINIGKLTINDSVLSASALDNCLKLDAESENIVSSYNEFVGRTACFELPADESFPHTTGPLVQLNADTQCHV